MTDPTHANPAERQTGIEALPDSMPISLAVCITAAMAAAWGGVTLAITRVTKAVSARARPTPETICEGRKSPFAQSCVRPVSIQLPAAITANPTATSSRASTQRNISAASGTRTIYGRAIQFSTSPICSARRPWTRVR